MSAHVFAAEKNVKPFVIPELREWKGATGEFTITEATKVVYPAKQQELAGDVDSLIAAIKADCAEGNMAQSYMYHSGSFRMEDDYAEKGYYEMPELGISISGEDYTWWISVYPDSLHTLHWLQEHEVLNVEVRTENIPY